MAVALDGGTAVGTGVAVGMVVVAGGALGLGWREACVVAVALGRGTVVGAGVASTCLCRGCSIPLQPNDARTRASKRTESVRRLINLTSLRVLSAGWI